MARSASEERVPTIMKQGRAVPWFYVAPALVVMLIFIVYPMIDTIRLSFMNFNSTAPATADCVPGQACWGILENYRYALTSNVMLTAFRNNLIWIVLMVTGTIVIGLLVAVLSDRVPYERLAKAIIFLPMAISFVGAGVIWRFVYFYGTGQVQIGLLNAILTRLGAQPVAWLQTEGLNNLALIVVGIWLWSGFCMTILAAALRGVPTEILEAARVDGANEWRVFWAIIIPSIAPTIAVVATTMVINVLKIFDIVYVMTGGNYGTDVIALRMYTEMYNAFRVGRATAIAVILIILIIPFIYLNIRRFQAQEATR